jgi:hypothetical protein
MDLDAKVRTYWPTAFSFLSLFLSFLGLSLSPFGWWRVAGADLL